MTSQHLTHCDSMMSTHIGMWSHSLIAMQDGTMARSCIAVRIYGDGFLENVLKS